MRKFIPVISALILSACVGPDYERPKADMPNKWPWQNEASTGNQQQISRDWWKQYNDPELTMLVEEGVQKNTDLLKAAANVALARAQLSSIEADLFPEIDYQGSATRTANSRQTIFSGFALSPKPYNDLGLAVVLNYEIDLWGKVRRATESARAELLSSQANQDAIRLAVESDIATGYFNLLALNAELEVAENTIKARQEEFDYQNKQYTHGAIDGLTFQQAQAELAAAQSSKPAIEHAREQQVTALAILLGRSPKEIVEGDVQSNSTVDSLPIPPVIPSNLPSTLLERRPDLQASEQNLVALNADIGVVEADYFPTLSISGLLGLESSQANHLIQGSARHWTIGANVAGPLIDFGKTTANVNSAKAERDAAIADYQRAIQNAFKDVLDAMNAEDTSNRRVDAETVQVRSRAETLRLAQLRYKAGYSNYLEVTDAQRNLYQAQLDSITAKRDRLVASVSLYKSLGGGWSAEGNSNNNPPAQPAALETAEKTQVTK